MKKFIALVLMFVMASSVALASEYDIVEFNLCASVYGASKITGGEEYDNDFMLYHGEDCNILFSKPNRPIKSIAVRGKGENFIIYSIIALYTMGGNENLGSNISLFMMNYLLTRTKKVGEVSNVILGINAQMQIEKYEDDYSFIVVYE